MTSYRSFRVSGEMATDMLVCLIVFWACLGTTFLVFSGRGEYGTTIAVVIGLALVGIWSRMAYKQFIVDERASFESRGDYKQVYWALARVCAGSLLILFGTFLLLSTVHPSAFAPIALGAALCYWQNVWSFLCGVFRYVAIRR